MAETETELLNRFYTKFRDAIDDDKLKESGSVLIASLTVKNNARFEWLKNGSIRSYALDHGNLTVLINRGHVRETEEPGQYTITALGVWEVECCDKRIDEARLLEFIDKKFFAEVFPSKPKFSDKEKVIVLSMIAARSFSEDSCIDLHKDDTTKDSWQKILQSALAFLAEYRVIKRLSPETLFGKKGNEHPVSNLVRHTDGLRRKSMNLFKSGGNQTYYLDLWDGETLSNEKLSQLFAVLFRDQADVEFIDEVIRFCEEIAYGPAILVYDLDKHKFSTSLYDDMIRNALRDMVIVR